MMQQQSAQQPPHGYPCAGLHGCNGSYGMTLRDHFAGLAMQGLLTNSIAALTNINQVATIKTLAYALADAMLKEDES